MGLRDDDIDPEEHRLRAQIFALLVKGHAALRSRSKPAHAPPAERFRSLLERFGDVSARVAASDHLCAAHNRDQFRHLLAGYDTAFEEYRRKQELRADDFNLLEVLQATYKEIRHSMVLAWLLDHDLRNLGTHAQGPLGFRLFLRELSLPAGYADCSYRVRREVSGDESIVDVEVACRGRFLIHIENKIRACEGTDQTHREWSDVERRAAELGLDPLDKASVHALFLSPHGTKPASPHFRAVAWGTIVRALELFATIAKPADVRLFASHYARALRRFVVARNTSQEENNGSGDSE